jgi:hypothetical protein
MISDTVGISSIHGGEDVNSTTVQRVDQDDEGITGAPCIAAGCPSAPSLEATTCSRVMLASVGVPAWRMICANSDAIVCLHAKRLALGFPTGITGFAERCDSSLSERQVSPRD